VGSGSSRHESAGDMSLVALTSNTYEFIKRLINSLTGTISSLKCPSLDQSSKHVGSRENTSRNHDVEVRKLTFDSSNSLHLQNVLGHISHNSPNSLTASPLPLVHLSRRLMPRLRKQSCSPLYLLQALYSVPS
jgi:hypothetical protein